jgi:hypothetical protein
MKESIHGERTFLFQVLCREFRTVRDARAVIRWKRRRSATTAIPRELSQKSVAGGIDSETSEEFGSFGECVAAPVQ